MWDTLLESADVQIDKCEVELEEVMNASTSQPSSDPKVPSTLWRTSDVSGQAEVLHPWGRTATLPIIEALVDIDGDDISVWARTEQPVLEGAIRSGYWMPQLRGKVVARSASNAQAASQQVLSERVIYTSGVSSLRVCNTMTAIVVMDAGQPVSVMFTYTDYAMFDVPTFIAAAGKGGVLVQREAEALEGFDSMGIRQYGFCAVFYVKAGIAV